MGFFQLVRGAGEERRGERMQDGQREYAAGGQQETILPDGLRELRPEIGRRGHAPTQSSAQPVGNLLRRLTLRRLVRPGPAQGADEVHLGRDPLEADFRHRGQRFGLVPSGDQELGRTGLAGALPGFGHPIHKAGDPRVAPLRELARRNGFYRVGWKLFDALANALEPRGVPRALGGLTHTFAYNRLDELDHVFAAHGKNLAAVVMESTRGIDPEPGFLEGVRQRCTKNGTLLVFDEITIGWRLCLGGAHMKFGVEPDMAAFAKAISNGFALGAVIGTRPVMEAVQTTFISSAYWTEGVGPAAGLAAVGKMQRIDVPAHLGRIGGLMMEGWQRLAEHHALPLRPTGRPENASLVFDHPEAAALVTLLTVRMLSKGFLAGGSFNAMLAHEKRHVDAYIDALDDVCVELRDAVGEAADILCRRIGGPVKHTGFARLVR